ncbi:ABC transporter permease [Roseomonas xinghualingensis]|uniref:ABC transporter permease n=1 Tax=Roseomonas xinghualingensis TaxID=2986475 RepID=UPI0021F0AAE7|nr:iron ABC transporter permease [Roseomonas sp. SXEYE001]MCV4208271.1 iron ABC transporter permease [Roseomonas sp. SXEYE001]
MALVALPVVALAVAASRGSGDLWPHLIRYVLPQAAVETALLLAGVGAVVVGVGTGTAWLVSCYRFPGRKAFAWALVLPLALPTYVSAYAWLDVMHPAGPVQSGLRAVLGLADPRAIPLPEIRSLPGCVMVMGMVLFPYVYLAARAAFLTQGADLLRAGRGLGSGGLRLFLSIGLPMARPAIAAGAGLALLETLNDVGAAEFLGVRTLTVSVYVTWITRSSLEGAAQIALLILLLVAAVLLLEGWGRSRSGGTHAVRESAEPDLRTLPLGRGLLAGLFCLVPVLLGFAVPVSYLLWAASRRVLEFGLPHDLGAWIGNSALLSAIATLLILPAALVLAFGARGEAMPDRRSMVDGLLLRASLLGYALPGGIAAVGLIVAFGGLDDLTEGLGRWVPALSGTATALVVAYFVRFLAIPAGGLDAAYVRIRPQIDWSARSMGARPGRILGRVHLPLLLPALSASALLVFLDAMKELPATLLLRPFNRETLATALYAEAARGTYEEGAVAALALVLVGLPVIALLVAGGRPRMQAPRP